MLKNDIKELIQHEHHFIEVVRHGSHKDPHGVSIHCNSCNLTLLSYDCDEIDDRALTKEEQAAYIANKGLICPFADCDSNEIQHIGEHPTKQGLLQISRACMQCGRTWHEHTQILNVATEPTECSS